MERCPILALLLGPTPMASFSSCRAPSSGAAGGFAGKLASSADSGLSLSRCLMYLLDLRNFFPFVNLHKYDLGEYVSLFTPSGYLALTIVAGMTHLPCVVLFTSWSCSQTSIPSVNTSL